MRIRKIQKMMKTGTRVPRLLILTQRRKKGSRQCWPRDSLKSKKSGGALGCSGKHRKPTVVLKVVASSVKCFYVVWASGGVLGKYVGWLWSQS